MIPDDVARAEFGLDCTNKPVETSDPIVARIKAIDPAIDELQRAEALEPVLVLISLYDEPRQSAYLSKIRDHFDLPKADLEPFNRALRRMSKALGKPVAGKAPKEQNIALGGNIVDLAEDGGRVVFLVLENEALCVKESITIDGEEYLPPPKASIPWLLPPAQQVVTQYELDKSRNAREVDARLFEDIKAKLEHVSELPSRKYYLLTTAWAFHTYRLERCDYSPIISLFAVHERGKSRTGKALVYLAYHGMHVESLREPFLFRLSENFCASLFIDVIDLWGKARKTGSEDILTSRFERGINVPRVLYPDRGSFHDTQYFKVFSPTIIGTNEPVDARLDSRAIEINMPLTSRTFHNEVRAQDFLELKIRLISFRARYMNVEETEGSEVPKAVSGRLGDISRPLLQTIRLVAPHHETEFRELLAELEEARKAEKSQTLEGLIVRAIVELEEKVHGGKLAVREITNRINEGRTEKSQFGSTTIGRRLTALGFEKLRMSDTSVGILYDKAKIAKLLPSYGLGIPSEPSEPSAGGSILEGTEGTEGHLGLC